MSTKNQQALRKLLDLSGGRLDGYVYKDLLHKLTPQNRRRFEKRKGDSEIMRNWFAQRQLSRTGRRSIQPAKATSVTPVEQKPKLDFSQLVTASVIHRTMADSPPVFREEIPSSPVVSTKSSKVFHKPNCHIASRIQPANMLKYNDRSDAIEAGLTSPKCCNP